MNAKRQRIAKWNRPKSRILAKTNNEMCRALKMSRHTFSHLVQEGAISRNATGLWDSDEIIPILEEREDRILASTAAMKSPALERWRSYRAELARLELEQKRGSLLTLESVRDGLTTSNAVLCARLATYARRAALALGQPGIEAQLDSILRQDLQQCRLEVAGVKFENPGE